MKIGIITQPNAKGQIVIPKKMREQLGITQNSYLNLLITGSGLLVHPVSGIYHEQDSDKDNEAFLKILRETQGAWGPASKEELKREKERRKIELRASARAKKAW